MASFSIQCPHCKKHTSMVTQSLSNTVKCEHCAKPTLDGQPVEADAKSLDKIIISPIPVIIPTTIAFKKGRQQAVLNTAVRKNELMKWLTETLSI